MRAFSYILMTLIAIFVVNVALSFALPGYRDALVTVRSQLFPGIKQEEEKTLQIESQVARLEQHIASLAESGVLSTQTGSVGTGTTVTGTTLISKEEPPEEVEIPVSGIFLAKVMPDIILKKVENKGFFGIQIFSKIPYSTYVDTKKGVKVYAFADSYDTLLVNMKLANNMYEVNETDQFFGFTFFLNPIKKDTTIRFITSLEGRAIGIEVPKNYYSTLKKILLKK